MRVGCCYNKHLKMWQWLWNWVTRSWKGFEIHAWNSLHWPEQTIKGDILEHSREALIFLENTQVNLTRVLLEIRTEKAALIGSQMEMESVCLETEAMTDLMSHQRPDGLCRSCLWNMELLQWSRWAMKLGIKLRKYLRKVLKEWPGHSKMHSKLFPCAFH